MGIYSVQLAHSILPQQRTAGTLACPTGRMFNPSWYLYRDALGIGIDIYSARMTDSRTFEVVAKNLGSVAAGIPVLVNIHAWCLED